MYRGGGGRGRGEFIGRVQHTTAFLRCVRDNTCEGREGGLGGVVMGGKGRDMGREGRGREEENSSSKQIIGSVNKDITIQRRNINKTQAVLSQHCRATGFPHKKTPADKIRKFS